MTIAVGFRCDDGVILAADTEITHWQSRSYESKILDISAGYHSCYLAYSGDVMFTKEITEDLKEVVAQTEKATELAHALKRKIKSWTCPHF
jgi:20S proteasome alpha/beta subunit